MAYSSDVLAAISRLASTYNGNAYNESTNAGGLAEGGHRYNFVPALQDLAEVAQAIEDEADAAAASASAASGYASNASTSASNASTSASNASNSADEAAASAASTNLPSSPADGIIPQYSNAAAGYVAKTIAQIRDLIIAALANDTIGGDKIHGGTISNVALDAASITALAGALSEANVDTIVGKLTEDNKITAQPSGGVVQHAYATNNSSTSTSSSTYQNVMSMTFNPKATGNVLEIDFSGVAALQNDYGSSETNADLDAQLGIFIGATEKAFQQLSLKGKSDTNGVSLIRGDWSRKIHHVTTDTDEITIAVKVKVISGSGTVYVAASAANAMELTVTEHKT